MKQTITIALVAITLSGSSTLAVAQQQSENRLKSVAVERYESGVSDYVPGDSVVYNWALGEGAGSADFRGFPNNFWGWYFQEPVPSYDETGIVIKSRQQQSYDWNDITNQFDEASKTELTLDAGGLITEQLTYQKNSGSWQQLQKVNYTYQNSKLVLREAFSSPDGINWENAGKSAYTYYASGDLKTLTTYQGLINNQWKPKSKKSFVYSSGLRTQETTTKWDDVTNDWETHPHDRYDYSYNSNNLCDTVIYSQWSSYYSALDTFRGDIYNYNSNGFIVEYLIQDANNTQHIWRTQYRRIYSYNYSYPVDATSTRWNDQSNTFDKDVHWEFTFDGELLKRIEASKWDKVSGSWEPDPHPFLGRKTTFYYEAIDEVDTGETGIHTISPIDFKIYPNPATNKITVQLQKGAINHIQITNAVGQVVFESKADIYAGKVTLPVSQLAPGMYYLQVKSGRDKGIKAFVVQQ